MILSKESSLLWRNIWIGLGLEKQLLRWASQPGISELSKGQLEALLTQNEASMNERGKKSVSLEEELLSHNEEEDRKELSEKEEKARKGLPDLHGCREEKALQWNQHQKELEGMLQEQKKLWKQLRNQEEIQHLHAKVRQLHVR